MIQFDKTYISPLAPEGLIETDHLDYLIGRLKRSQAMCQGQLDKLEPGRRMTRGKLMKHWLRTAREIARLGRELFKLETHNHFITTKWAMLRDPAWRTRVMRELGGEIALQLWEQCFARAETKAQEPVPDVYGPPQTLPASDTPLPEDEKTTEIKTDNQGQFRLAQISRGPRPWRLTIFQRRTRNYAWNPSWQTRERMYPPIPVTPEELRERSELRVRGDTSHNPHPEADTSLDGAGTRRTRVMATVASNPSSPAAIAAPQDEVHILCDEIRVKKYEPP